MTKQVLHVSDTHLGKRQYGSDARRADFADAFEQAIRYAIDEDVDAVIHTGDLFDTREPRLPDLNRCIDTLELLDDSGIPFYGIVGNHERKMDAQYLDLIHKTGTAKRLSKSPTMIGDEVALYGIDAVTKPAWHTEDFTLEEPPSNAFTILCMHELLHPPVPELFADHPLDDVLDRVNVDLDALALGDYHATVSTVERGTTVWYAGSTERCALDEDAPRTVSLLEIDDGEMTRREKELDTRDFLQIDIQLTEGDGNAYLKDVVDRYEVDSSVAIVKLTGEPSTVTSRDVRKVVMNRGAAVCQVDDQRGGPDVDLSEGPTGGIEGSDKLIEDKLAEQDLSDVALQVEERVRTEDTSPTGFDEKVRRIVREELAEEPDDHASVGSEAGGAK